MTRAGVVEQALEGLKDDYSSGTIGLDTFESRVATVLATEAPPRPPSLLDALMQQRRIAYVGRSPRCHLVLGDESVSRTHALLVRDGRRVELIDLDSTNGTLVNGRRVARVHVRTGDRVTLGLSELVL